MRVNPCCISRTLRFKDAVVRRAYYDYFWQTPWRLFAIAACLGINACYYAIGVGLAWMPLGHADWIRLGIGGRDGVFASAITAWSVVTCAYFLTLGFLEKKRLAGTGPLSSGRRPPAGLLNPSGLGLKKQDLLLALLLWPLIVIRVVATVWRPVEVLSLSSDDLYHWEAYEAKAFLTSITLGLNPVCALLGVPAVIVMPQALLAALTPVVGVWFEGFEGSYEVRSYAEVGGMSGLAMFMGTVTFGITYANAILPLLIWKTVMLSPCSKRNLSPSLTPIPRSCLSRAGRAGALSPG